jgi:hypothetical protein
VSGGTDPIGRTVLMEGNGKLNFHANSPNTPAAQNGFNGNGATITFI